ncbi:MAG: hypothetical protein MUP09_04275 [Thiovulaceae bacterium]|nr:hypothetical protein [Sulfurimonadaceae bacterium]
MILYLHGFASCGDSTKTRLLKEYFGEEAFYSPDLPLNPDQAVAFIDTVIKENRIELLIGSSLGGFYASFFCEKYKIKTVLINPSTEPHITLAPYVGTNRFWCSGEPFEWKESYLDALAQYNIPAVKDPSAYLLLLQKGDELLDYSKAVQRYRGAELSLEEGGNHRFENLNNYLERINEFYKSACHHT